ncbi:hypothetical protein L596_010499 [Steinernema carpocapsae]|uniref:Uncharacterized protein n=1 Tax=Steinernema carpocapsae TaxID=34508 RepID=A0A4U5PIN7_STECR|nr:hypothetical protein L596_010499 [Steinernema carpocapsae]
MTVPTAMLLLRQLDEAANLAFETMGSFPELKSELLQTLEMKNREIRMFKLLNLKTEASTSLVRLGSVEKTIEDAYEALDSLILEAGDTTRATIQRELSGWLDKADNRKPRTKEALTVVLKQERSILAGLLLQLTGICDEMMGRKRSPKTTTGARGEDSQEEESKSSEEDETKDLDKDVDMRSRSPSNRSSCPVPARPPRRRPRPRRHPLLPPRRSPRQIRRSHPSIVIEPEAPRVTETRSVEIEDALKRPDKGASQTTSRFQGWKAEFGA